MGAPRRPGADRTVNGPCSKCLITSKIRYNILKANRCSAGLVGIASPFTPLQSLFAGSALCSRTHQAFPVGISACLAFSARSLSACISFYGLHPCSDRGRSRTSTAVGCYSVGVRRIGSSCQARWGRLALGLLLCTAFSFLVSSVSLFTTMLLVLFATRPPSTALFPIAASFACAILLLSHVSFHFRRMFSPFATVALLYEPHFASPVSSPFHVQLSSIVCVVCCVASCLSYRILPVSKCHLGAPGCPFALPPAPPFIQMRRSVYYKYV